MDKKPWLNSLWMDCPFELLQEAKKLGKGKVASRDVDKLVIEKSKVITKYEVRE